MSQETKDKLSKALKGKTYEELFGIEKANEIKEKAKISREWFKHTQETKDKISKIQIGKTHEERMGKEKAEEVKKKLAEARQGKTYEELFGVEKANEIKEKLRISKIAFKHNDESKIKIKKARANQKIVHSQETKDKISLSHIGKKHTEESKIKMSNSLLGKKAWNKGLTAETTPSLIGKPRSEESKKKSSKSLIAAWQDPEKRKRMTETNQTNYKYGIREDLGFYCHSALEANYARFLKWFGMKYEFESDKCIFKLSNEKLYICDFYLPELDMYIEMKGYLRPDAKEKLELFKKDYPNIKWRMIMQDSEEWKQIVVSHSQQIPCCR